MTTIGIGCSDTSSFVMIFQWVSYKPILGKWMIRNKSVGLYHMEHENQDKKCQQL